MDPIDARLETALRRPEDFIAALKRDVDGATLVIRVGAEPEEPAREELADDPTDEPLEGPESEGRR